MSIFTKAAQFGEDFLGSVAKTELGKVINPFEAYNREQFGKYARLVQKEGITGLGKDYFAGKTITSIEDSARYTEASSSNLANMALKRKMLYGAAFGLAAANSLDINPGGLTDKATSAAFLGAHYTIGRGLMGMGGKGKIAGIGYLAATALNTFREGDQQGPM